MKNLSRVEFLGMVGLFGTLISTIQMLVCEFKACIPTNLPLQLKILSFFYSLRVILERDEVVAIQWSWQVGKLLSEKSNLIYVYTVYIHIDVQNKTIRNLFRKGCLDLLYSMTGVFWI